MCRAMCTRDRMRHRWNGNDREFEMSLRVVLGDDKSQRSMLRTLSHPELPASEGRSKLSTRFHAPPSRSHFVRHMLAQALWTRSPRSAHTASCTPVCTPPALQITCSARRILKTARRWIYLAFDLHAVPQVHGELSNIRKRVLIRSRVVSGEQLRSRILHEVDGW